MLVARKQMSSAEQALAAAGLGALAIAVAGPEAKAASTIRVDSGGTIRIDLDGDTTNGDDLRLVPRVSSFVFETLNPMGVATLPSHLLYYAAAKRFAVPTEVATWTGAWSSGGGTTVWDAHFTFGWEGNWDEGEGYLGFRVDDGEGGYDYGWVQIRPEDGGDTLVVLDWRSAGASASGASGGTVGATGTPEPSGAGLALLALGAAGVMRQRRRVAEETAA